MTFPFCTDFPFLLRPTLPAANSETLKWLKDSLSSDLKNPFQTISFHLKPIPQEYPIYSFNAFLRKLKTCLVMCCLTYKLNDLIQCQPLNYHHHHPRLSCCCCCPLLNVSFFLSFNPAHTKWKVMEKDAHWKRKSLPTVSAPMTYYIWMSKKPSFTFIRACQKYQPTALFTIMVTRTRKSPLREKCNLFTYIILFSKCMKHITQKMICMNDGQWQRPRQPQGIRFIF